MDLLATIKNTFSWIKSHCLVKCDIYEIKSNSLDEMRRWNFLSNFLKLFIFLLHCLSISYSPFVLERPSIVLVQTRQKNRKRKILFRSLMKWKISLWASTTLNKLKMTFLDRRILHIPNSLSLFKLFFSHNNFPVFVPFPRISIEQPKDGNYYDDGKLIIVTDSQILSIPLHRCHSEKINSCRWAFNENHDILTFHFIKFNLLLRPTVIVLLCKIPTVLGTKSLANVVHMARPDGPMRRTSTHKSQPVNIKPVPQASLAVARRRISSHSEASTSLTCARAVIRARRARAMMRVDHR